jgi:hypothetical protein
MRAVERSYVPDEKNSLLYKKTLKVFRRTAAVIAELGDYMHTELEEAGREEE